MIQLTPEQTAAALQNPNGVECTADGTGKVFLLVDNDVVRQMKAAIERQETIAAVHAGNAEIEAGLGMTVEEADRQLSEEFGLPRLGES